MEDHLVLAIKNLTAREKDALQKRISQQKQKLKLFQSIEEKKTTDTKILSEELEYGTNFTGLYTLKNRLFDDIVEVKLTIKKNPLVVVKEKIQNLRNLVYDKDKVSLLREIKRLEKNAESYELFNELKEVYFCMLLTFRHDKRKALHYQTLMNESESRQILTDRLEQLFYMHLLDTPQDMFYAFNKETFHQTAEYITELEKIYRSLDTKAAHFLYQSAALTIRLNSTDEIEDEAKLEEELNELLHSYSTSFLPYKYPHCQIAIHCLYSKFYLITGNTKRFTEVQNYINSHLEEVEGFQMFDCSYYYYLYATVLHAVQNQEHRSVVGFIDKYIQEEEIQYKSDKMKMYYLYLLSAKYYYAGDYNNCFTSLMKSRNYFSQVTPNAFWICVENILLSILINIHWRDFDFIYSELDLLKRLVRKFNMEEQYANAILHLLKAVKQFESDAVLERVLDSVKLLKDELHTFKLIDLGYSWSGSEA